MGEYKFVTKEEVDTLEKQLGDRIVGPWFGLVRALLAERDAYRQLANRLCWSDDINHPVCPRNHGDEDCGELCRSDAVNLEARRILTSPVPQGTPMDAGEKEKGGK